VYGVPEQWPHIRDAYARIGFTEPGRTELIFVSAVDTLPRPAAPLPGLVAARSVGISGTRISALLGAEPIGYVEVDTNLDVASRMSRLGGWADVGNRYTEPAYRRRGVGTWLSGQAADWLELGGVTRLLDYADPAEEGSARFLRHLGFRELTRTVRGLTRPVGP